MSEESDLNSELLWLRGKLAEVVRQNDLAEGTARRDLAALLESRAWRLTRPIRWLGETVRRKAPDSVTAAAVSSVDDANAPPFRRHASRIGVDISMLCEFDHESGIQRVVRQIARHLVESRPPGEVVLLDMRTGWPADATWRIVPTEVSKRTADWPVLELKTLFLLDASWHLADLIGSMARSARRSGVEVVACIYDLIPIDHPETCRADVCEAYGRWLGAASGWCDHFICISEAVARRLVDYLRARPGTVCRSVGWWPLGCDFAEPPPASGPPPVSGRYALMVGTLEPRKRHGLALDAFEMAWKEELDVSLVIVGKPGWHTEKLLRRLKSHPEMGKRLFWFGGAGDAELASLYVHASVILQPSVAEGFGLPVVEGGRFGKPVVLSDIPVFRELVLGHGYFFTPDDPGSLVEALRRAMADGAKPTSVLQTSWRSSAEQLRDQLLDGSRSQIKV